MNRRSFILIVLCVTATLTPTSGHPVDADSDLTSANGIRYWVDFQPKLNTVHIHGHNPTERRIPTGIVVQVDDMIAINKGKELLPNGTWDMTVELGDSIDVLKMNHSVLVSTFGDRIKFNFTRTINTSSSGPIPVPYIKNVEITNGTIDGEPSAVAEVTVANPSKQTYPTKLMVHTTETHGSFYPAAVPPGETRTITVELLDERGSKIAGEARLYTEGLNKQEGAMDQVEFVGRAGAGTDHWNVSYRPVRPPWEDDSYRYRNSSVSGNGGVLPGASDTTLLYVAVGVLVLLWVVRKVR